MTIDKLEKLMGLITYKRGWTLNHRQESTGWLVWWEWWAQDSAGHQSAQKSRKWYISPHMTDSEVIQTFLKAVLTAEEHEARETFAFAGAKLYGPHIDAAYLVDASNHLDKRT